MSYSALSDSFEYLCYRSTAIRNIFSLTVRGSTLDVRFRQILTTKVDPRAVRVKAWTNVHAVMHLKTVSLYLLIIE